MEVCFKLAGKWVCIWIPIYYIPIRWPPPHPDPGPYRELVQDATILASVNEAAKHISDEGVRRALQSGIAASMKGMQDKAGGDIKISLAKE
jgi:hypothetical protein